MKDMTLIDPETQEDVHLKRGETLMVSPKVMRDPSLHQDPNTFDGFRFYKLRFGANPQDIKERHESQEKQEDDAFGRNESESAAPISSRQNMWQLTSLSPDHPGFGLGPHSCPGRFWVASELKIALCHMIMKYDWKLASGPPPEPFSQGNIRLFDLRAKILVKKRDVELSW